MNSYRLVLVGTIYVLIEDGGWKERVHLIYERVVNEFLVRRVFELVRELVHILHIRIFTFFSNFLNLFVRIFLLPRLCLFEFIIKYEFIET